MSNEFKVGDHVMCVDNLHFEELLTLGKKYIVKEIHNQYLYLGDAKADGFISSRFILNHRPGELHEEIKTAYVEPALAKKETQGKPPLEILMRFPGLKTVAQIFSDNTSKYPDINGDFNFRSSGNGSEYRMKLIGACLRHVMSYCCGDKFDSDSGKPHLYHAVCNLLMVADIEDRENK